MRLKSHEWFCKVTIQGNFLLAFPPQHQKNQTSHLRKVAGVLSTFGFEIIVYIPSIFRFVGYLKIIP
jgi:hypothetical protein